MKNKICFLMPIYPPHFGYAKSFIESFYHNKMDKQANLAFVFTNINEASEFKELVPNLAYEILILPASIVDNINMAAIVNIKKFYGLQQIQDKYDYTIIFDSESLIIKDISLIEMCKQFESNKILYGNLFSANLEIIFTESSKFFKVDDIQKVDNNLYLWYNQPCIYINSHLNDFFNKTNLINLEQSKNLISWGSFDYYVYMYYLILFQNFKIKNLNVKSSCGFLEDDKFEARDDTYKDIDFHWCSLAIYEKIKQDKIFCLMHIDRAFRFFNPRNFSQAKINLMLNLGRYITSKADFLLPFRILCSYCEYYIEKLKSKFTQPKNMAFFWNNYQDYKIHYSKEKYCQSGFEFLQMGGGVRFCSC